MTETQWLTANDPTPMLEYAREQLGATRRRAGRRRLILLACACMRRVLAVTPVALLREAITFAEQDADDPKSDAARKQRADTFQHKLREEGVHKQIADSHNHLPESTIDSMFIQIDCCGWFLLRTENIMTNVSTIVRSTFDVKGSKPPDTGAQDSLQSAPGTWQALLMREIFGNPFRPVSADQSWLTSTVTSLAEGMYQEREFTAMPILADALQDAGCDNDDILNHCRLPGEHVRGCWVVDLVLGKS